MSGALKSILRAIWRGRRHQGEAVDCGSQRQECLLIPDKVSDGALLHDNAASFLWCDMLHHDQRNFSNPVHQSEKGRSLEVDDRSVGACDSRNGCGLLLNVTDRRLNGFVDHNCIPWLWDTGKECWLPAAKSNREVRPVPTPASAEVA